VTDPAGSPPPGPNPGQDLRKAPRHSFTASAEILDPATETKLSVRVSELSMKGCYLDALNPFPPDTIFHLRIVRDVGSFETSARIAYVHPGFGMGATFIDTPPDQLEVLAKWLAKL
jgi:hypothetical protein